MKLLLVLTVLAGSVFALESELEGIENCPNKCDKVFDRTQYAISDQPNSTTFEYRSCLIGCGQCQTELTADQETDNCFTFCKTYNYGAAGIRKGVIEPDKACLMGCVINTCQLVCIGGTTDQSITAANQAMWWGQPGATGCSIKTGLGYVQNYQYGNPNSPGGQGGSSTVQQCCTNAFNLCEYTGPQTTTNFKNVQLVARRSCASLVPSQVDSDICTFWKNAQNCGTTGMGP